MARIARILCPIDFSDHSRRALDHGLALSRWYGASVTAVHVIPRVLPMLPSESTPFIPPIALSDRDLERFRNELAAFVDTRAGVPVDTRVLQGTAADGIVRTAEEIAADVIVMGTHGRTGFERFVLGSVTERVLRRARCAVLTIPPLALDTAPDAPVTFRHVLCALDFSPLSRRAVEDAASLAMLAGARLTALHVIEHSEVVEPALQGGSSSPDGQLVVAASRARLHEIVGTAITSRPGVTEVVVWGKPYREILEFAEHERVDLIVVGVHGALAGTLGFGSTANHVVRTATCPVWSLTA